MNEASNSLRGRPLIMLALVLLGWVATRVLIWESPLAIDVPMLANRSLPSINRQAAVTPRSSLVGERPTKSHLKSLAPPKPLVRELEAAIVPKGNWQDGSPLDLVESPDIAGGHQLLWMAAMAHLPVPRELNDQMVRAPLPDRPLISAMPMQERWSLDAWVFWREGSDNAAIAQGRVPSYGASQAAAVLQYRLAPQDDRDPRAYVRAYQALIERGESELAFGISARPLARLPVRAHAEFRVTDRVSATDFRPAVFVTSEIAPISFPAKLRAETYVQAGYVGGKGSTAFADGQVHILRDIEEFDLGRVSLGGGAWGGAQEGANRLDLGPSLRFDLELDEAPARLSLDYRERVAGNAEPPSGATLTISTRF